MHKTLIALVGLGCSLAQAQPAALPACQACHGAQGISASNEIPNLAGQKRDYLVAQLEAFKSGTRKNELMAAIAAQLASADIKALAAYWSALPAAPATPTASAAIAPRMLFPADFPKGFTLYETAVDEKAGPEVARRYANDIALAAARAGRELPAGSVIIVANHANASAPANSYAGMEAKAGWGADMPELLRNGDWGYAVFNAAGQRQERVDQAGCLACHKPVAKDSYVFSLKALVQRAKGS